MYVFIHEICEIVEWTKSGSFFVRPLHPFPLPSVIKREIQRGARQRPRATLHSSSRFTADLACYQTRCR